MFDGPLLVGDPDDVHPPLLGDGDGRVDDLLVELSPALFSGQIQSMIGLWVTNFGASDDGPGSNFDFSSNGGDFRLAGLVLEAVGVLK